MLKPTPEKRVLFARRLSLLFLVVAGVFSLVITNLRTTGVASAATAGTVNFQARLQTASGAIVPDGSYNVEFRLYDASSGGTAFWTEDHLNSNSQGLQTINGYLSTALGSVTAFPSGIDWSQKLWLTMNIGGTTTDIGDLVWDGEMNPRLALTAQPYAFQAGRAAQADVLSSVSNGNTSTLTFQGAASDHGSQNFVIQDQGAAGTYNLLTQSAANNSYVQLQSGPTFTEQVGNLDISGTAIANTLQVSTIDAASTGTLSIGTTNATSISLAQDTTLAAGKSLTVVGGVTSTRPSSPTKGMLYYDTSTNQLLQYSGTKWVGSQKAAVIVAASNSSQADKDAADYVATGTDDQNTLNAALTALPAGGGTVYVEEGTYTITGSVSLPNNVTLSGAGASTLITIPDNFNTAIDAIVNATAGGSGQGITIRDMRLDGNGSNQSSCATMEGIVLTSMGSVAGVTNGALVEGVEANNWCSVGFKSASSSKIEFTDTSTANNGWTGYYINGGSSVRVVNSQIQDNPNYGIYLDGASHSVISGNTITDNGGSTNNGVYVGGGASDNSITDNHISDSSCSSSCYAINISDSGSTNNYLSDNILTGDGSYAATVNNAGTGTIYNGQMNASDGGFVFKAAGDSANAFSVQDTSGTSAFNIDTTNNQVNINDATTIASTTLVKTTDVHALAVQDASGATMLNVDSSTSSISLTNTTVNGDLTVTGGGNVVYQHGADYSVTGLQNNVDFGKGSLFRLTGASAQTITGIAGGTDGRRITIINAGTTVATLSNNSDSSSTGNKIITGTGNDFAISAGSSVELVYDSTSGVWRIVSAVAGGVGGGSYVALQTPSLTSTDVGSFRISGTGVAATLQAASLDTATATMLNIGATNATGIALGTATTLTTTSATALKIQDASNNILFTADTSTGTITFGTGSNTVIFTASGGLMANGTAQHTKKITLAPEYAGAVLDALADSTCSGNSSGTMTSGYANGLTGFGNTTQSYYQWLSSGTNQCYDVVTQVPLPSDFSSWASNMPITINTYSSNTTNGTVALQAIASNGATESSCNFVSATPASASTWTAMGSSCSLAGTYTAGGYMTVRLRLTSSSGATVRLGNLTLSYKSNF